jgi:hypothetical protein
MRDAASRERALVRFVHAYQNGGSQEVYFGDVRAFPNVAYKAVTAYIELPGERRDFRLFTRGSDAIRQLTSTNEGLWEGRRYTVISSSRPDGLPMIQAFHDDLLPPSAGKARVRVIHLSPSLREIDVYAGDDLCLLRGVSFREATSYIDVEPGKLPLELHRSGERRRSHKLATTTVTAGNSYTFIITGAPAHPINALIRIEDGFAQPPVRVSSTSKTTIMPASRIHY